MSLAVLGAVYPVILLSELPDKTMFAALALATRGRALAVWIGAAAAFAVHVSIAVSIGAALFTWLPQRAVEALAAALFLGGAVWILCGHVTEPAASGDPGTSANSAPGSACRAFFSTFAIVFLAEWGDLTQLLTVGLAARFHDPVAVGVGAGLALWSAAVLAVVVGQRLHRLPPAYVRRLGGIVLLVLFAFSTVAAITGS